MPTILVLHNDIAPEAPAIVPVSFTKVVEDCFFEILNSPLKVEKFQRLLTEILQQDPRPAYQDVDINKLYRMTIKGIDIGWRCERLDYKRYGIQVCSVKIKQGAD